MAETIEEKPANFSLIIRAYDGYFTGEVLEKDAPVTTSGLRPLTGGEADMAAALIIAFTDMGLD